MDYRYLGKEKLKVSAIGYGGMGLSPFYENVSEKTAIESILKCVDVGINFFDVADIYGFGLSEERLGKAIKSIRDDLVIATKGGIVIDRRNPSPKLCGTNTSYDYIKKAFNRSLARLNVDHIDLYYLHRIDTKTPIEESISALSDLKKEGKLKHIGLSEVTESQIREASKIDSIAAVQSEYSLWYRRPEKDGVLDACKELGIGFVPFSPMGRGFLAGSIIELNNLSETDFRRGLPRFRGDVFEKNKHLLLKLKDISHRLGTTEAKICLSWLLNKGDFIVPIPGSSSLSHIVDNSESVDLDISSIYTEMDEYFAEEIPFGDQFSESGYKMFSNYVSDTDELEL
jgi:aryl-alcohol dehydrogenase-like predicted oxidoreductase|tara:strand:- start:45234 stop:46259 length:1026 start_codon:yes stop_codon:yes gene_type:complete